MRSQKKYKVIVLGLPKTGTSTLAVMLRILNYKVTGPNGEFKVGDENFLNQNFIYYDGFQDFPWCFEWQHFFKDEHAKFIILKRDKESWWKSFNESYGRKNGRYLSSPYFKIKKDTKNKDQFLEYYDLYYKTIDGFAQKHAERFLSIDIRSFEWKALCDFLEEPLPRNLLGQLVKKPHINKRKSETVAKLSYQTTKRFKKKIVRFIGKDKWNQLVTFFRKNGLV